MRLCTWRKNAVCLYDNNILTTTAVWPRLLLCGLPYLCFLFDIGTANQGGCGCMTWSIGNKNKVNVITLARTKKKRGNSSGILKSWEILIFKCFKQLHKKGMLPLMSTHYNAIAKPPQIVYHIDIMGLTLIIWLICRCHHSCSMLFYHRF